MSTVIAASVIAYQTDIGWLGPGARADAIVLDAPHYAHMVHRPGMPLVAMTLGGGRVV